MLKSVYYLQMHFFHLCLKMYSVLRLIFLKDSTEISVHFLVQTKKTDFYESQSYFISFIFYTNSSAVSLTWSPRID